jgi:hypothetical protein
MVKVSRKGSSAETSKSANSFKPSFVGMDSVKVKVIIQKRDWIMVGGPRIRTLALGGSRICHS